MMAHGCCCLWIWQRVGEAIVISSDLILVALGAGQVGEKIIIMIGMVI